MYDVKHRVRTTGSEHQGQNSISDPDQNLGFTCIFSSGMQETSLFHEMMHSESYGKKCKQYRSFGSALFAQTNMSET